MITHTGPLLTVAMLIRLNSIEDIDSDAFVML